MKRKYKPSPDGDYAFAVHSTTFKFGAGLIQRELGQETKSFGMKRVALFTGK
jgi:hydroxyacid-oxoacid transhydrogenase